MTVLNHRIGRVGFALGYLPVLVVVFALVRESGYKAWHVDGDPKKIALFAAILFWSLCLTAWRCHDYNKSAWSNFFTEQVPIVGSIVALWGLLSKPGDQGFNSYGPPPKF
jgi:uncharacterized membrane protein YhaH (DUF805 family)